MGDHDSGDSGMGAPDVEQFGGHSFAGEGVEGAKRFIEEEEVGLMDEGASDGDALGHSTGELSGIAGGKIGEANEVE